MQYTESHEWLLVEGTVGTVGITRHAKKELGDVVYIELPKLGEKVQAGEEACVLESTKAAVDVYSPVSGTVIAVNEALGKDLSLLNGSLAQDAWLFRLEISDLSQCEKLLSLTQYEAIL
jgi:glycine cleavage system H protein